MTHPARVPPHNLQAEESLLGAMLLASRAIDAAIESGLEEADFYKPAHGMVWSALVSLHAQVKPCDPATVGDELTRRGQLEAIGDPATLVSLQAGTPSIGNAGRYARIITDHSVMRRLIKAGSSIMELGYELPNDVTDAIDQARLIVAGIDSPGESPNEAIDVGTFVNGEDHYDWLVSGLIERGDRVLVVAAESAGKSMLLRQVAVCCAYGIHPFKPEPIDPVRVLLLDLENPVSLVRRKVRTMVAKARTLRPFADETMMSVLCRPGGIDVTKRSDARWLAGQLSIAKPDLVIAGPLYKMFSTEDQWERGARTVTAVLDDLRTRLGFALVLETHAPQESGGKRNLRPIGSSIWLRWPEFVLSFCPEERHPNIVRLSVLKGRDQRQIPQFLERGGDWPWTPCRDPEGPKGRPDKGEPGFRPGFGQEQF